MTEHESTKPPVVQQIESMRATLQSIESQIARSHVPSEGLPDLKSAIDEIRTRVWAIMTAAAAEDGRMSLERFRLRRALEIFRSLERELDAGTIGPGHSELAELRVAAAAFVARLEPGKSA